MVKINLGQGLVEVGEPEDIDLDTEELFLGGVRLTEADAAALAQDIARRHGLRGGRPAKHPSERASVQKAFRLTTTEAELLAEAAKREGVTESAFVRSAVLSAAAA